MDTLSPPKKFPRLNRKPARNGVAEFGQHLDFNKLMMRNKNEFIKFLKLAYPVIQEAVSHLGYLKNNEMHEDCMQEVAILLYRNIDTYRGDGNLKGWIYTVTQNYGIDIIRRKNRRKLLDEDLQYLLKDDQDVEDPEFRTRESELKEIFLKKFGKLPVIHQEALASEQQSPEDSKEADPKTAPLEKKTLSSRKVRAKTALFDALNKTYQGELDEITQRVRASIANGRYTNNYPKS